MAAITWIILGLCVSGIFTRDPMEDPDLFQGDMIMTDEQIKAYLTDEANSAVPLAAIKTDLWPKVIPYSVDQSLANNEDAMGAINAAIADYHKDTCLRFVARTDEPGYIHFYKGGGCSSPVGYFKRRNRISLADGCWHKGIVMHEIAHSLGFYHEQSRPDRDNYVIIRWENIYDRSKFNFEKQKSSNIDSMSVPYDYESIMHYSRSAFAKGRGLITIETIDKSMQKVIGRRSGFSHYDILQMNILYSCPGFTRPPPGVLPTKPPVTREPGATTVRPCSNRMGGCNKWKREGLCTDSRYKKFMRDTCPLACGFCKGVPTKPPPIHCEDKTPNCKLYVSKGYCTHTFVEYMRRNCKRSCKFCPGSSAPVQDDCMDNVPILCEYFNKKGYCTKWFTKYMKKNCQKTCGLCTGDNQKTSNVSPINACSDLNRNCDYYARVGYCKRRFVEYMKKNCKKACGLCSGDNNNGNCGKPEIAQGRVIAGVDAKKGAWPWQILMLLNGRTMCGGSLISPRWVVTAAHCVFGRESLKANFRIRVGEHITYTTRDGQHKDIAVEKIIAHPSYTRKTIDSDIALIKLASPAIFGKYVKSVCLPGQDQHVSVGTECFITGWGKIKHPGSMHHTLQQGRMPVVDNSVCGELNTKNLGIPITPNMVCAGHGGITKVSGCHGDSGGPFVCRTGPNGSWVLHGAVSWGSGRCDAKIGYTVFARVSKFRSWIDQEMSRN